MVKAIYKSCSAKTTKIIPEFTDAQLTNYGGLIPFADFLLEKLPFRQALAEHLDLGMGPNCSYQDWQVFALIVFGYLCGYKRIQHFEQLSRDTTVQRLLGLEGPIDENTLAYRLKRAGYKQSVEFSRVSRDLTERVGGASSPKQPKTGRCWYDFDSSVKGVFGNQQGAAKGFNPTRKGQKSYHPLLAFDAATKEVLHSWWRTGKAYSGNGAAEFVNETIPRLAETDGQQVFRADSGFFGDRFLSAIEQAGYDYLVKVKLKNLRALLGRQDWHAIPEQPDTAYCEFTHQCAGWEQPRRFCAVRIVEEVTTEGRLFPEYSYYYACYVTTLEEAPLELHRCYGARGECENWIEAVKNQLGAGTTLVEQFWANALLWQLGVLAYNLSVWLRLLTDQKAWRQEPRTFREWFIRCAGKLVYHARRWSLNMQSQYYWRARWETIYQQLCKLRL